MKGGIDIGKGDFAQLLAEATVLPDSKPISLPDYLEEAMCAILNGFLPVSEQLFDGEASEDTNGS
ncbi:hypothetical protein FM113_14495 [Leucobacter sp. 7(1)]|nr:hypothetical protein FM113_14495 [Leucobacter sp. 7(1)]